jgi:hypothetical protein
MVIFNIQENRVMYIYICLMIYFSSQWYCWIWWFVFIFLVIWSEVTVQLCKSYLQTGTITFDPTFGSFILLEPSEPISFVKVFRLFRLKWTFLGVQSVDTVGTCTTSYLLAGPVYLWCLVFLGFVIFESTFLSPPDTRTHNYSSMAQS